MKQMNLIKLVLWKLWTPNLGRSSLLPRFAQWGPSPIVASHHHRGLSKTHAAAHHRSSIHNIVVERQRMKSVEKIE